MFISYVSEVDIKEAVKFQEERIYALEGRRIIDVEVDKKKVLQQKIVFCYSNAVIKISTVMFKKVLFLYCEY